eukprot:gnl/TRDRNA2_/TRDRNA2_174524_c4_seq1.p1 gnl/TRDRNA2_/TRDRNA2_174524_c4~~gnl/TRDRNA2_/TRDRNA2_174524_c4_seq1.p1  ORF type:complete len:454 (+),score=79.07 gnl/TRDRNA2_/TRDRNA2_174524_c4_seq1:195-1364(+)
MPGPAYTATIRPSVNRTVPLVEILFQNKEFQKAVLGPLDDHAKRFFEAYMGEAYEVCSAETKIRISRMHLNAGNEYGWQVVHIRKERIHIWDPGKSNPPLEIGDAPAGGVRQVFDNMKWQNLVSLFEEEFRERVTNTCYSEFEKLLTGPTKEPLINLRSVRTIEVPVTGFLDRTVLGGSHHATLAQKAFSEEDGQLGYANLRQLSGGFTVLAIIPPKEVERKIILFPGATDVLFEGDILLFPLVFEDEDDNAEHWNHLVSHRLNDLQNYELFRSWGGMPWTNGVRSAVPADMEDYPMREVLEMQLQKLHAVNAANRELAEAEALLATKKAAAEKAAAELEAAEKAVAEKAATLDPMKVAANKALFAWRQTRESGLFENSNVSALDASGL